MKFRETTQEDLDFVAEHSVSRGIMKGQPKRIDFCCTLEHEGKVLGIGGIRLVNLTTAWAWVDITEYAQKHMILSYRVIKEWMAKIVQEKGIKRLQAYIEPDFPEAIRMAKHLGFHKESIMENFLPNGDALMYKRIF